MQRDTAAVGMSDEVHFPVDPVDQTDRAGCLVRQRERVIPAPGSGAFAAVVLGSEQLVASAAGFREVAPLASAAPRAVQAKTRPRRAGRGG